MNNKEKLESHHRLYSWIKELSYKDSYLEENGQTSWETFANRYPEIVTLVESLLANLELLNIEEGNILYINYRDYKLKIYLDVERNSLSGEVEGINGDYDSDSLTNLKEQLERAVDEEIGYKYQSKLAERNSELTKQVINLKAEIEKLNKII